MLIAVLLSILLIYDAIFRMQEVNCFENIELSKIRRTYKVSPIAIRVNILRVFYPDFLFPEQFTLFFCASVSL